MTDYKLYIFDVDRTLVDYNSDTLLPGVRAWFEARPADCKLATATNQGGVALRLWMESGKFGKPDELPTEREVWDRLHHIKTALGCEMQLYVCFAYQSKSSGKWAPTPQGCEDLQQWMWQNRKPEPGMLKQAMLDQGVTPEQTIMIGDSEEDQEAAKRAGCAFMWAHEFFGREV